MPGECAEDRAGRGDLCFIGPLREAAVLAIQLGVPVEQIGEILKDEYNKIDSQRTKEKDKGGSKEQTDV
jgi:hypothetical protein